MFLWFQNVFNITDTVGTGKATLFQAADNAAIRKFTLTIIVEFVLIVMSLLLTCAEACVFFLLLWGTSSFSVLYVIYSCYCILSSQEISLFAFTSFSFAKFLFFRACPFSPPTNKTVQQVIGGVYHIDKVFHFHSQIMVLIRFYYHASKAT